MATQKRRPPWGATKKQGAAFAKERALKNRIRELEADLDRVRENERRLTETNVSLNMRVNELSRKIALVPDPAEVTSSTAMLVLAKLLGALSTGKVAL